MRDLARMDCVPCRGGVPTLSEIEVRELQSLVSEWMVTEVEGVQHLERVFKFKNFTQALEFTNKVGEIAEAAGHHPAILTEWGKVTISWWTHAIKGLHRNDFIMAAKTDEILEV